MSRDYVLWLSFFHTQEIGMTPGRKKGGYAPVEKCRYLPKTKGFVMIGSPVIGGQKPVFHKRVSFPQFAGFFTSDVENAVPFIQ